MSMREYEESLRKLKGFVQAKHSLAPFFPTTFVGILPCRCYTVHLTSKLADMCGCTRKFRSNNCNANFGPCKSAVVMEWTGRELPKYPKWTLMVFPYLVEMLSTRMTTEALVSMFPVTLGLAIEFQQLSRFESHVTMLWSILKKLVGAVMTTRM